jgi:hypothetical protein
MKTINIIDTENKPINITDTQLAIIIHEISIDAYEAGMFYAWEKEGAKTIREHLETLDITKYIK